VHSGRTYNDGFEGRHFARLRCAVRLVVVRKELVAADSNTTNGLSEYFDWCVLWPVHAISVARPASASAPRARSVFGRRGTSARATVECRVLGLCVIFLVVRVEVRRENRDAETAVREHHHTQNGHLQNLKGRSASIEFLRALQAYLVSRSRAHSGGSNDKYPVIAHG
jgi:hypothetical protein